jgi:hypothetical protein
MKNHSSDYSEDYLVEQPAIAALRRLARRMRLRRIFFP